MTIEVNQTEDLILSSEEIKNMNEPAFRVERDALLSELDRPLWYASLSPDQKLEVDAYYTALLDSTINWVLPEKPSFIK